MKIRPTTPGESNHPHGSPEDSARRHVQSILYISAELRASIEEREPQQKVNALLTTLKEHVGHLTHLRTKLSDFDVQLALPKVIHSYNEFRDKTSLENASTFYSESVRLGSLLQLPGCNVAAHVEDMKSMSHLLMDAAKNRHIPSLNTHINVLQVCMNNLNTMHIDVASNSRLELKLKDALHLLNQNFLILQAKFPHPDADHVAEWQKALNEFPPIT